MICKLKIMNKMNEILIVFMILEIERFCEEGCELVWCIYYNMLCMFRESVGKEEIGFEEVILVFLGKYEYWLLGKWLSWNMVLIYMCVLCVGYNWGMKGCLGYVIGFFDKVYIGMCFDVKCVVDVCMVGCMICMLGCLDELVLVKVVDWFVLMFMLWGILFVDLVYLCRSNFDKGVLIYCWYKMG